MGKIVTKFGPATDIQTKLTEIKKKIKEDASKIDFDRKRLSI